MGLRYILVGILVFFVSCSKEQSQKNETNITKKANINIKNEKKIVQEKNSTVVQEKNAIKKIKLNNFELIFKDNKLIYPNKRIVLLFENNNTYSYAQKLVLKRLKIKYIKANSKFLQNYFNITIFPTIIVLDKNKTVKYENFVPYEILKAEGF